MKSAPIVSSLLLPPPQTSDPGPSSQLCLPAPHTWQALSRWVLRDSVGLDMFYQPPKLRSWFSLLCKPLVRTFHARAQNPTQRDRIKAGTCFLLGTTSSQPCVQTRAPPTRRPGPGDGRGEGACFDLEMGRLLWQFQRTGTSPQHRASSRLQPTPGGPGSG